MKRPWIAGLTVPLLVGAMLVAAGTARSQATVQAPSVVITPIIPGTGVVFTLKGPCVDVMVLGARGSGETVGQHEGFGDVVYPAIEDYVKKVSNRRVAEYAIDYPAESATTLLTNHKKFFDSIWQGQVAVESDLVHRAHMCPNERYVLAGYSQGAMVMHRAYWGTHNMKFDNGPLDNRLDGLLLIANGDRLPNQTPSNYGTASKYTKGISWWVPKWFQPNYTHAIASKFPSTLHGRARSICEAQDLVCAPDVHQVLGNSPPVSAWWVKKGYDVHVNDYTSTGAAARYVRQAAAAVATRTSAISANLVMSLGSDQPTITEGQPFAVHFSGSNGFGKSYTFRAAGLPSGMTLTSAGVLNGTAPPSPVTFNVGLTDSRGQLRWSKVTINPSAAPSPSPTPTPATWANLTTGSGHTCGVKTDGTGWCWGSNYYGQLGNSANIATSAANPTPTQVSGSWTSLSAGDGHTCGVKTDGTGWCWGDNYYGQLGDATNNGIDTGTSTPAQVAGSWKSIEAGGSYTCGVKTDDSAWCWGINDYGQLGTADHLDSTTAHPDPVQVAGTWTNLSVSRTQTCGTKTDGTVWCWGYDNSGQLGDGMTPTTTPQSTPVQVSGTWTSASTGFWEHTCGMKPDGTGWCWGANNSGELGNSANSGAGTPNPTPLQVAGAWSSLSAGEQFTCGVKTDGTAWCWGVNNVGQLGSTLDNGYGTAHPDPTQIAGTWRILFAGTGGACGIKTDGTAWCWGENMFGERGSTMGNGSSSSPVLPTQVPGN